MRKLITTCILAFIALFIYPTNLKPSSGAAALSIGNETDRLALLAFKDRITKDPLNIITSWNTSIHFCKWKGVSCSTRHPGRVTALNLEGKKLTGFRGEIPTNLSYCYDIHVIDLFYNNLLGGIPEELSSLSTTKLKSFRVAGNGLTGSIPPWLGNLSSLVNLYTANNHFKGVIPSELGRLLNLEVFDTSNNNLSGEVPPSIYNMSSLLYLDIIENKFYGKIPQDIGFTLPNLLGLYVGGNQFTGQLPVSLSNASGLQEISFASNNFAGTMLTTLGSLKDMARLTVGNNELQTDETEGFSFLTSLTNCSKLQVLEIGSNRFKGDLPASLANFSTALQQFNAGANQISGSIPEGITNLIGLKRLTVYVNSITGKIPEGIGKLERLEELVWQKLNWFHTEGS